MNRTPSTAVCRRLADNVLRLRRARGLTQAQLGAACGLTASSIGSIEQASINPTLASLEALTVGLECSLVDLFYPLPTPADRRAD